jgi:DNA-binding transcriptional regulator YiaG
MPLLTLCATVDGVNLDDALAVARDRRRLPPPPARQLLRERAGVTMDAVAGEVGVTRAAVSRWEAGEREPRPGNLARYLAVLDRLAREALAPS